MTKTNTYIINGHTVKYIYAGIDTYSVDDKDVCWSISDLAKLCGVSPDTVKEELWNQRNN